MNKRINITLPEETIELIDQVASNGKRSRFIDKAVHYYTDAIERKNLHDQMKEGYIRWADRDRETAEDWFPLDEEAWQKSEL